MTALPQNPPCDSCNNDAVTMAARWLADQPRSEWPEKPLEALRAAYGLSHREALQAHQEAVLTLLRAL